MSMKTARRVHILTLGCRSNQYDSEWLRRYLLGSGYQETESLADADYVIINSCVVTHKAERDVRKLVSRARREGKPGAQVILTGCMVPLHRSLPVDFQGTVREVRAYLKADRPAPVFQQRRTRAVLRIQDGCSFQCTYCIVPKVRGPAVSKPLKEILREAQDLVDAGFQEIVITGTQVGGWGRDLGFSLRSLFEAILGLSPRLTIRVSSMLPHYLDAELLDFWASEPRLLPHFHLPLQSGSPRILRVMKRPYTLEFYERLVMAIHERLPHAGIGTDLIVGFPGETEEDFQQTVEILQRLPFTYAHIFEFSPREGTEAATLPDPVPAQVRKARVRTLLSIVEEKKRAFLRRHIGRTLRVLVEREIGPGQYLGTSENYLRVKMTGRDLPIGTVVSVRVTGVEDLQAVGVPASRTPTTLPMS